MHAFGEFATLLALHAGIKKTLISCMLHKLQWRLLVLTFLGIVMSGFFETLKQNATARAVGEVQNLLNEKYNGFRNNLAAWLNHIGLKLEYAGLIGANAATKTGGMLLARFNDYQGNPITLMVSQGVYEGSPPGNFGLGDMRRVYWSSAIWGSIVKGSAPFTMLFREIPLGFLKGKAKVFIAHAEDPTQHYNGLLEFDDKKLYNSPLQQTPILLALNADMTTCGNLSNLRLKCQVNLTHKAWLTLSCQDNAGKCAIVPFGNETGVFIRNFGDYGDPGRMMQSMDAIRRIILANPQKEATVGLIPNPWVTNLYVLCKTKTFF